MLHAVMRRLRLFLRMLKHSKHFFKKNQTPLSLLSPPPKSLLLVKIKADQQTEVKFKTMHTLISKEAHLPYRRKKKTFKTQFIKYCDTEKASFYEALLLPIRKKSHSLCWCLPRGLISFQILQEKEKSMCHINGFTVITQPLFWMLLWSHSTWAQSGPTCILIYATFQHLWLYCLLGHKNYAVTAQWNEQEEIWTSKNL